jgi:pimeloyl-ACP methyl ester carboxylesterase
VWRYVQAADGRRLACEVWGDPKGAAVFLLHGTPGSRRGPRPRPHELALMGIRLIAYDRPGYGLSDRDAGRQVADAAADVAAVADALGIDRFAVVGRSGGGPHALACAALLPGRVTAAAALVSLAPRFADGLDWFAGMGEHNVREFTTAWRASDAEDRAEGSALLARRLARFTDSLTGAQFIRGVIHAQVPDVDREILADPGIRRLLAENFRQAAVSRRNVAVIGGCGTAGCGGTRPVLVGWLDDLMALSSDWGFRPDDIRVPVLLWHGEVDTLVPVDHSRWLGAHIPGATLVVQPGAAHFGALVVLPAVLGRLRQYRYGAGAPR